MTSRRFESVAAASVTWLARGAKEWSPRFVTADTPGYPDCNPAVFADRGRCHVLLCPRQSPLLDQLATLPTEGL